MSIDDVTTQLRSQLQEAFGVEGASYLMDRPPGGWSDLVTNESLDRRLASSEHSYRTEMAAEFAVVRADMNTLWAEMSGMRHELLAEIERAFNLQTWRLTTAVLSSMAVLVAVMVAAIRL